MFDVAVVVIVAVVIIVVDVVAEDGIISGSSSVFGRCITTAGDHHRRSIRRTMIFSLSVTEPTASLFPLALRAPGFLVLHAVHFATFFVLATCPPIR